MNVSRRRHGARPKIGESRNPPGTFPAGPIRCLKSQARRYSIYQQFTSSRNHFTGGTYRKEPKMPSTKQVQIRRREQDEPDGVDPTPAGGAEDLIDGIDDLLDDIDSILEEQSVLTNYRQRSGQ